jgi:hypothetical protein
VSDIAELTRVIEHLHGCKAAHYRSMAVREEYNGRLVWEGTVEVFALFNHPKAQRCYAWKHWEDEVGKQQRTVTVLEIPPVNSPTAAVRAAIVADHKRNRTN